MARPWTEADQEITDKREYFVITIYKPPRSNARPITHAWGPGPAWKCHARRREVIIDHERSGAKGSFSVMVVRWRGGL